MLLNPNEPTIWCRDMSEFKHTNVEIFHKSMDCLKKDNFTSFRALVDPLDPLDREEVLQMYKKAYHYLKTGNPNPPPKPD